MTLDTLVLPSYIKEILVPTNTMILDCSASEIITRLRNISEIDGFILSEADNYKLEDLDFISSES